MAHPLQIINWPILKKILIDTSPSVYNASLDFNIQLYFNNRFWQGTNRQLASFKPR